MSDTKFDEKAAIEQAKHEDSDGYFGFLSGAEWQFAQMQSAMAEKDAMLEHSEQGFRVCRQQLELERAKVQKLEEDHKLIMESVERQRQLNDKQFAEKKDLISALEKIGEAAVDIPGNTGQLEERIRIAREALARVRGEKNA